MGFWSDIFSSEVQGRTGVLPFEAVGGGLLNKGVHYQGYIEVEEVSRHNDLSKIRVIKVSGAGTSGDIVKERVPDYVKTEEVQWLEDTNNAE